MKVPHDLIDYAGEATWAAAHQQAHDEHFAQQIAAGQHVDPAVMVWEPGESRIRVMDGHHRTLGSRDAGVPVDAYVGILPAGDKRWTETHSFQEHQGNSPANKAAESPYVAGLMVRAGDTGRVLMLQRAITEDDPAAGRWEPPGGHAEPGETLLMAALREWAEETGLQAPRGTLTGSWDASNGIYRGFVLTVPSEDAVHDRSTAGIRCGTLMTRTATRPRRSPGSTPPSSRTTRPCGTRWPPTCPR